MFNKETKGGIYLTQDTVDLIDFALKRRYRKSRISEDPRIKETKPWESRE